MHKEEDDDAATLSSTMGSVARECGNDWDDDECHDSEFAEEDWQKMDKSEREESISSSLKKLGNIKRRPMSDLILKDMLGTDAECLLEKVKNLI